MAKAMFGAGCFWDVQVTFDELDGVTKTEVGYTGGTKDNPTYEEVCKDNTGHAEVVHITYDPNKVTYETLLEVFFSNHNPTQLNKQGPDVGTQYRSAIFYYDEKQKEAAEKAKENLAQSGKFLKPIVTEITKASRFWKAEDYHQKYLEKRGMSSCHI